MSTLFFECIYTFAYGFVSLEFSLLMNVCFSIIALYLGHPRVRSLQSLKCLLIELLSVEFYMFSTHSHVLAG